MSKCDTVVPLIFAMKKRRDVVHITAETIKKLYDLKIPELVEQVGVVVQDVVGVLWIFLNRFFQLEVLIGYGISGGVAYSGQMIGVVTAGELELYSCIISIAVLTVT